MYRKEVNVQSPLRILERSIHGGLGKGNLGVVMAPAGVGKTACLVQIGLDDLMRERDVIHVAIGQSVEHVSAWYDALFDDLANRASLDDKDGVRESLARHRAIKTFSEASFSVTRLEEAVNLFVEHLKLAPQALLVDGFDWQGKDVQESLKAMKALARKLGAELWLTAQTPRGFNARKPAEVTPPCDGCARLIEVGIFLEPLGSHVAVRLVKDHGDAQPPDVNLRLDSDTLRLVSEDAAKSSAVLPAASFTLLSGGAPGAEDEFGACAERWGLHEVNYTFTGRKPTRSRGVLELNEDELKEGDVSHTYVAQHMHRAYPDTPLFRKVLQMIWHQVNTAAEVFSVGQIQYDGTVKGGTGWAVELARHWHKPVFVYDQEKRGWFTWQNNDWVRCAPEPRITRERFAGTGTRFLTDHGRDAIRALFERSFGPAKQA